MDLTDKLALVVRRWLGGPRPRCFSTLTLSGQKYRCDHAPEHPWAHSNKAADAFWHG